jgi:hypothetical protein
VATFGITGAVSDPDGVPMGSTTAGIVVVDIGLVTTVFAPGVILAIDAWPCGTVDALLLGAWISMTTATGTVEVVVVVLVVEDVEAGVPYFKMTTPEPPIPP